MCMKLWVCRFAGGGGVLHFCRKVLALRCLWYESELHSTYAPILARRRENLYLYGFAWRSPFEISDGWIVHLWQEFVFTQNVRVLMRNAHPPPVLGRPKGRPPKEPSTLYSNHQECASSLRTKKTPFPVPASSRT